MAKQMPRILTFNAPPKLEKKIGKENPFKSLWESFRSLDRFTKGFIVTTLILIIVTPFIVNQYLNYLQNAQQLTNTPEDTVLSPSPSPILSTDTDADGFSDFLENYIGT